MTISIVDGVTVTVLVVASNVPARTLATPALWKEKQLDVHRAARPRAGEPTR
jgi:hypothetical protein